MAGAWIVAGALALRSVHGHSTPRQPSSGRAALTTARIATPSPARTAPADRRKQKGNRGAQAKAISVTLAAARGRSWVVVRAGSSRGPVRYEGILEQGHTLGERGRALWTQIGAVGNVDVRVDGRLVQLGSAALGGVLLSGGHVQKDTAGHPEGVVGS
jgi:hypothetical protein